MERQTTKGNRKEKGEKTQEAKVVRKDKEGNIHVHKDERKDKKKERQDLDSWVLLAQS